MAKASGLKNNLANIRIFNLYNYENDIYRLNDQYYNKCMLT